MNLVSSKMTLNLYRKYGLNSLERLKLELVDYYQELKPQG